MQWALSLFLSFVIRVLSLTWRVRLLGPDPYSVPGPRVFCFWHGNQAGLFGHPRPHPLVVMSSLSRDGSLQARILSRFGIEVVRGSSSRGGAMGLRGMVRAVKGGRDALFAVDGPRGPYHEVKSGAAQVAILVRGALIPLSFRASRAWVFAGSWDRYCLPKPFALVEIVRGAAISVAGKGVAEVVGEIGAGLERGMRG